MAEEIDFENGRNWNFEGLVTLTLTFDPAYCPAAVIDLYLYTKFHSNWRNFLWTDGRTDGQTDIFPLYIIRSTFGSRPKKSRCTNENKWMSQGSWVQCLRVANLYNDGVVLAVTFACLIYWWVSCFQIDNSPQKINSELNLQMLFVKNR